jgi:hypothetical protein
MDAHLLVQNGISQQVFYAVRIPNVQEHNTHGLVLDHWAVPRVQEQFKRVRTCLDICDASIVQTKRVQFPNVVGQLRLMLSEVVKIELLASAHLRFASAKRISNSSSVERAASCELS